MTAVTAPASPPAVSGRAAVAFARAARRVVNRAATAARTGGATAVGAAGLASIAVGAGMVYLPAGFIVGGGLAVWFASLLPRGAK